MKFVCHKLNIKTPEFVFVYDIEEDLPKTKYMNYPLIVKLFDSNDSMGLTPESKVHNF